MPQGHLTLSEREVISQMRYTGASLSAIGNELGRPRGTISREIKRNTPPGWERYYAHQADWMAQRRRIESKERFVQHSDRVWSYVKKKLREGWSPEQTAGRMADDFADDESMRISHETIYAWIGTNGRAASTGSICVSRDANAANVTAAAANGDKSPVAWASGNVPRWWSIAAVWAIGRATRWRAKGSRAT